MSPITNVRLNDCLSDINNSMTVKYSLLNSNKTNLLDMKTNTSPFQLVIFDNKII